MMAWAGSASVRARSQWRRAWPRLRLPVAVLTALLFLFLAFATWIWVTTDLDAPPQIGESAVVLDRNGTELAVLARDGTRIPVDIDDLPDHVPAAVVAAEDRQFYDHPGIDPVGVVRAFWNNLTDDDVEGGSTITQQLVKNVHLDSSRTVQRKVREAVVAVKLERSADKDDILERYLNSVYFGRGSYGVEAASRAWFGKSAAGLTVGEAALLAGMLHSPESYDPIADPSSAEDRRDMVLAAMVEEGSLDRDAARKESVVAVRVAPAPPPTQLLAGVAPHFVEQVRADVIDHVGEEALYGRGLRIHTTLDLTDQRAAESAISAALDDPADPQAALVAVDRSGAVRAWVGGRDFAALQVDLVSGDAGSGRQPGSTFKAFVLAAAFRAGIGGGTWFAAPDRIALDVGDEPWEVENVGGVGYGQLTLADATVQSVNTVYAQLIAQVGPEAVADLASDMGIASPLDAEHSIALGTEEVTPLDLVSAFSTLSREGARIDPYRVLRIETADGDTLWERDEVEAEPAVEPEVANTVSAVLGDAVDRGTATRVRLDRPVAAKTGTTQNNADAWLAGYTPEYTAVVWVGHPDGNTPMDVIDGERVFGGTVPARIWHDFMVVALEDVPPTEFPSPDADLLAGPPAESIAISTSSSTSSSTSTSSTTTSPTSSTTAGTSTTSTSTSTTTPTTSSTSTTSTSTTTTTRPSRD